MIIEGQHNGNFATFMDKIVKFIEKNEKIQYKDLKKFLKETVTDLKIDLDFKKDNNVLRFLEKISPDIINRLVSKLSAYKNKQNIAVLNYLRYFYTNISGTIDKKTSYNYNSYLILSNPSFLLPKEYLANILKMEFIKNSLIFNKMSNINNIYNNEIIPIIDTHINNNNLKLNKTYNVYNMKNKVFTEKELQIIKSYFKSLKNSDNILEKEHADKVLSFIENYPGYFTDIKTRRKYNNLLGIDKNTEGISPLITKKELLKKYPEILKIYVKDILIPSYYIAYTINLMRRNINPGILKKLKLKDMYHNSSVFANTKEQEEIIREGAKLLRQSIPNTNTNLYELVYITKNSNPLYLNEEQNTKIFIENLKLFLIAIMDKNLSLTDKNLLANRFNEIKKTILNNTNEIILSKIISDISFYFSLENLEQFTDINTEIENIMKIFLKFDKDIFRPELN